MPEDELKMSLQISDKTRTVLKWFLYISMTNEYVQCFKHIAKLCFYFAFLLYNLHLILLWNDVLMSYFYSFNHGH